VVHALQGLVVFQPLEAIDVELFFNSGMQFVHVVAQGVPQGQDLALLFGGRAGFDFDELAVALPMLAGFGKGLGLPALGFEEVDQRIGLLLGELGGKKICTWTREGP